MTTTNILSPKWEGDTEEPIDPAAIRFKTVKAPVFADCQGCLFLGQRFAVCNRAAVLAVADGGVDCDDPWPAGGSVIYVIDTSDPRQLDLLKSAEGKPC
jgi:hypothetical protein